MVEFVDWSAPGEVDPPIDETLGPWLDLPDDWAVEKEPADRKGPSLLKQQHEYTPSDLWPDQDEAAKQGTAYSMLEFTSVKANTDGKVRRRVGRKSKAVSSSASPDVQMSGDDLDLSGDDSDKPLKSKKKAKINATSSSSNSHPSSNSHRVPLAPISQNAENIRPRLSRSAKLQPISKQDLSMLDDLE